MPAHDKMKQPLPWNVTGIPPEARDAARAAASRAGLSVGDWLTQRILDETGKDSSDAEAQAESAQQQPRSGVVEFVARRRESEADAAVRRIDESLNAVARRLDANERAQAEAQRALNTVASEIQAAAREQAEAFVRLAQRIEHVERSSETTQMREVVRGVHQGLLRLTEQIARLSADSAGQIAVLAGNLEALASKVSSTREDAARIEQFIDERLNALSERVRLAEERTRAGASSETVAVLEARINAVEDRMHESLTRHLEAIERKFDGFAEQLETDSRDKQQEERLQQSIASLSRRIEAAETGSKEALTHLQSSLADRISMLEAVGKKHAAESVTVEMPAVEDAEPAPTPAYFSAPVEQTSPARASAASKGALEYLAQARRAAQAAGDASAPSSWYLPGIRSGSRGRNRWLRMAIQGLLLLAVMAIGFLLVQNFAPKPTELSVAPTAEATTSESAPPVGAASQTIVRLEAKANAGDANAALLLGLKYADGDGVPMNDTEAAKWLQRAAAKGLALAQYRLGAMTENGRGVPANAKAAADLYERAAQQGNVKAMHNLAVVYANGTGREKNFGEAARWFDSAAERGLTDSQFNLAVLHERGLGVPISLPDAYKWYAIAAARGDAESKSRADALKTQILEGERQAADKAAQAFKTAPVKAEANEAPDFSLVLP